MTPEERVVKVLTELFGEYKDMSWRADQVLAQLAKSPTNVCPICDGEGKLFQYADGQREEMGCDYCEGTGKPKPQEAVIMVGDPHPEERVPIYKGGNKSPTNEVCPEYRLNEEVVRDIIIDYSHSINQSYSNVMGLAKAICQGTGKSSPDREGNNGSDN